MGEAFFAKRRVDRLPAFSYTGSFELIEEGGLNWRIEFKSSGTLRFQKLSAGGRRGIDAFLVGGGGRSTRAAVHPQNAAGCGGGGYTKTERGLSLETERDYEITVGGPREASEAFGQSAAAGEDGTAGYVDMSAYGGDSFMRAQAGAGGSAGGAGSANGTIEGARDGGSTGDDLTQPHNYRYYGAQGQGTTTRAFGESGGKEYSRGGGTDVSATPNSGNGGAVPSGETLDGASGIVIIRNAR